MKRRFWLKWKNHDSDLSLPGKRPFLEYQLELLRQSGINSIVLCAGYRWEAIQAHFGDGRRFNVQLTCSVEDRPLGTAGCLKNAEPLIKETILILNGDILLSLNPERMYRTHRANGAMVTVAVGPISSAEDYGSVLMNEAGRIVGFREKELGAGFINAGAHAIEPTAFACIDAGVKTSMEYEFLPRLLAEGQVLNTTIDKYAYATVALREDKQVRMYSLEYDLVAKYRVDQLLYEEIWIPSQRRWQANEAETSKTRTCKVSDLRI